MPTTKRKPPINELADLCVPILTLVKEPENSVKYQTLFDQASDAILTVSQEGKIDAANQALENLTGFLKTELVGCPVERLIPDAGRHAVSARARALSSEFFSVPATYEDVAVLRKDGFVRYVDLSVKIITSGKETLTLALFRDITEKKQMERDLITKHAELRNAYYQLEKKTTELQATQAALVQAGKMAALGELTAGIAHELNQPLQSIRGYAQELKDLTQPPFLVAGGTESQTSNYLQEIITGVDKMAGILDYMRTFTRKSVEKHESTPIHQVIDDALKMLSRQLASRGISVAKSFAQDLPDVYANPLQLEQVFINLATNARDAIEATNRGKGSITIRTRRAGNFIEILFRDDGCGMTERTKAKAFNPFFTTKEVGSGMGMGLSLSYGILSKIHGTIIVESELGKGATFLVRIPIDFRELA